MSHQDWEPVVFRKKGTSSTKNTKGQGGIPTTIAKKSGGGTNRHNMERKYKEDEDGMPITKGLPKGFSHNMQQARQAKGLKQKELAQKIGERVQVVQDYELGKVTNVNQNILRKIEKHLGKLR